MRRIGLLLAGLVVAFFAVAVWGTAAFADSGLVLVDDDQSFERTAGTGGDETADLTLSNPTDQAITVVPALPSGETRTDCRPVSIDPTEVPAQQEVTVTVTFANCPTPNDPTVRFVLNDDAGHSLLPSDVRLAATPPSASSPKWAVMLWFFPAGFVGFVVAVIALGTWPRVDVWWRTRALQQAAAADPSADPTPNPTVLPTPAWFAPLSGLASDWKFSDSWASNATVIAALFTGLFGATEITTTIIGDDAKEVLATVAVAVALGVALAATAPMAVQALQTVAPAQVTPAGIVAGSTLTIAATGGELWVVVTTVQGTDKFHGPGLILVGLLATVILIGYALAATWQNLSAGLDPVPEDPPGPAVIPVTAVMALVIDMIRVISRRHALSAEAVQEALDRQQPVWEAASFAQGGAPMTVELDAAPEPPPAVPVFRQRSAAPPRRKPSAIL